MNTEKGNYNENEQLELNEIESSLWTKKEGEFSFEEKEQLAKEQYELAQIDLDKRMEEADSRENDLQEGWTPGV